MSVAIDRGLSAASLALQNMKANTAPGTPAAGTPTATTSTGTTITSSDFLTLLVAEMKNQDPTQPTDPTQYVQQLVGVNSLEQLIDINKGVTSLKA